MISPDLISHLAPELTRALQESLPLGMFVLDLDGHINDANSYALSYIGANWKEGMPFASILEGSSTLRPFSPGSSETKILRIVSPTRGVLVMRCWFIFGDKEGIVLMLPSASGREDGMIVMSKVNDELSTLTRKLSQRNAELEAARKEISTLSGLLPICSHCKKINKGDDTWEPVESYVRKRTDADFTHSYCPDCYEKMLTDIDAES